MRRGVPPPAVFAAAAAACRAAASVRGDGSSGSASYSMMGSESHAYDLGDASASGVLVADGLVSDTSGSASVSATAGSGSGSVRPSAEAQRLGAMGVTLAIIAVTIVFEVAKHGVEHAASGALQPLLQKLFGELTVLGFIGVLLFILEQEAVLASISEGVYAGNANEIAHLVHVAHFALFFVMILYLFNQVVMVMVARVIRRRWHEWEDELVEESQLRTAQGRAWRSRSREGLLWSEWWPVWWGASARHAFVFVWGSDARGSRGDVGPSAVDELSAAGAGPVAVPCDVRRDLPPLRFAGHVNDLGELSSFYGPSPFFLGGHRYNSLEHWYQAQKFRGGDGQWNHHCENIRKQRTSHRAQAVGSCREREWGGVSMVGRLDPMHHRDPAWRVGTMFRGIQAKFTQHKQSQDVLLSTNKRYIVFHDAQSSWGVVGTTTDHDDDMMIRQSREPADWNLLGKLLMRVRMELEKERRLRGQPDELLPLGEYLSNCLHMNLNNCLDMNPSTWLAVGFIVVVWWACSWQTEVRTQIIVYTSSNVILQLASWAFLLRLRSLTQAAITIRVGGRAHVVPWWDVAAAHPHSRRFPMQWSVPLVRLIVLGNALHVGFFCSVYLPFVEEPGIFSPAEHAVVLIVEVSMSVFGLLAITPALIIALNLSRSIGELCNVSALHKTQTMVRVRMLLLSIQLFSFVRGFARLAEHRNDARQRDGPGGGAKQHDGSGSARSIPRCQENVGLMPLLIVPRDRLPSVRPLRAATAAWTQTAADVDKEQALDEEWEVALPPAAADGVQNRGRLSRNALVTLHNETTATLWPAHATQFAWACTERSTWRPGATEGLDLADPLVCFAVHGGWVYRDERGAVVAALALASQGVPADAVLTVDSAKPWHSEYSASVAPQRWELVNRGAGAPLVPRGVTHTCWIHAGESLAYPGRPDWIPSPAGAFVHLYADPDTECSGRDVLFSIASIDVVESNPAPAPDASWLMSAPQSSGLICGAAAAASGTIAPGKIAKSLLTPVVEDIVCGATGPAQAAYTALVLGHEGAPRGWGRQLLTWRRIFSQFDMDDDGDISPAEVMYRLQTSISIAIDSHEMACMKNELWRYSGPRGTISFADFYRLITGPFAASAEHGSIEGLFSFFDVGGSGTVSFDELVHSISHIGLRPRDAVGAEDLATAVVNCDFRVHQGFASADFGVFARRLGVLGSLRPCYAAALHAAARAEAVYLREHGPTSSESGRAQSLRPPNAKFPRPQSADAGAAAADGRVAVDIAAGGERTIGVLPAASPSNGASGQYTHQQELCGSRGSLLSGPRGNPLTAEQNRASLAGVTVGRFSQDSQSPLFSTRPNSKDTFRTSMYQGPNQGPKGIRASESTEQLHGISEEEAEQADGIGEEAPSHSDQPPAKGANAEQCAPGSQPSPPLSIEGSATGETNASQSAARSAKLSSLVNGLK